MVDERTFGQKAADRVAQIMGSWRFVMIQSIILSIWIILNVTGWVMHWDAYPFILLNLMLSFQAAYTAPIIMMSQNRQGEKDREILHSDFLLDQQTKVEILEVLQHMHKHEEMLEELLAHWEKKIAKEKNEKAGG